MLTTHLAEDERLRQRSFVGGPRGLSAAGVVDGRSNGRLQAGQRGGSGERRSAARFNSTVRRPFHRFSTRSTFTAARRFTRQRDRRGGLLLYTNDQLQTAQRAEGGMEGILITYVVRLSVCSCRSTPTVITHQHWRSAVARRRPPARFLYNGALLLPARRFTRQRDRRDGLLLYTNDQLQTAQRSERSGRHSCYVCGPSAGV